jgi:formylglycine-generating enzyme required for sulfatase activity
MARYPITIAQFQAFLQECYQDSCWRLPPGFPVNLPADYSLPKHRVRYGNHPADSTNWCDAAAFCHWLSARLSAEIRLPTEFEWQLAATGGDPARIYPWGREWDPEHEPWAANTLESGLNRTTAVGLYPLVVRRRRLVPLPRLGKRHGHHRALLAQGYLQSASHH